MDLNGQTLTVTNDTVGDGVFHVTEGGALTIDGTGTINGVGNNDYNMAIWADGGDVVINGGTFTNEGATASSDPTHMDLIYAKNGSTVTINGGTFKCQTPAWTLNCHDAGYQAGTTKIIVKGGSFYQFDPSNCNSEGANTNFVADGYQVVQNGDWYTVVPNA